MSFSSKMQLAFSGPIKETSMVPFLPHMGTDFCYFAILSKVSSLAQAGLKLIQEEAGLQTFMRPLLEGPRYKCVPSCREYAVLCTELGASCMLDRDSIN